MKFKPDSFFKFGIATIGLIAIGWGNLSFTKTTAQEKPNIIVILIDDAGYADFGFMGSKELQTPHIDGLVSQGILLRDGHVSASVCSPSRAGLLTGKYQQRFGYECNEGEGYTGMDPKQTMLPKLLLQQGYNTAAFGKWHLGFEPNQQPLSKGFQYYYGFLSGGRSYFYQPSKDDRLNAKTALLENNQQVKFEGYLTDRLGDKAATYIEQNSGRPFFMYWAPNAVHTPMEASKADLEKFKNHPRQVLAAMTFALDRAIGKMVAALKATGQFENTLIFFLSDNGGAHNNQSSNLPLKGFKGNKYEGGHRVPFFVSWPKMFSTSNSFNGLCSSLDILPTALEASGFSQIARLGLDGVSLLPFLKGEKKTSPHEELVWRKDAAASIRLNQFKLIRVKGLGERLYDLSKDSSETKDLQYEQPQTKQLLQQHLLDWEKDKMAPLWTEGKQWDTITLMIHDDLMRNQPVKVRNPEELKQFKAKTIQ